MMSATGDIGSRKLFDIALVRIEQVIGVSSPASLRRFCRTWNRSANGLSFTSPAGDDGNADRASVVSARQNSRFGLTRRPSR